MPMAEDSVRHCWSSGNIPDPAVTSATLYMWLYNYKISLNWHNNITQATGNFKTNGPSLKLSWCEWKMGEDLIYNLSIIIMGIDTKWCIQNQYTNQ
jgi:hypothetical protein